MLLSPHPTRSPYQTTLTQGLTFTHGRVHEICGPARRALALRLMAGQSGPVLWLHPAWHKERLAAQGIAPAMNPARIVFTAAQREEDLYWALEEALRSGAAPTIIAEVETPPALTPIRRLHLAAEASGKPALIALLTPEDGGAQGVESRWHMAPAHDGPTTERWLLTRLRARLEPPKSFTLEKKNGSLTLQNVPMAEAG